MLVIQQRKYFHKVSWIAFGPEYMWTQNKKMDAGGGQGPHLGITNMGLFTLGRLLKWVHTEFPGSFTLEKFQLENLCAIAVTIIFALTQITCGLGLTKRTWTIW